MASRSGIAVGQNRGHITTVIPQAAKPSDRKGVSRLFIKLSAWNACKGSDGGNESER